MYIFCLLNSSEGQTKTKFDFGSLPHSTETRSWYIGRRTHDHIQHFSYY